ncbi:MAG: hypothetical protein ACUZ8I_01420 [Candidatus Scalindua sp.]
MISKILNTTGLSFGIFGVIIIFFWSPPQPSFFSGVNHAVEDATPITTDGKVTTAKQLDKEISKLKDTHYTRSSIGLALVGVGFFLQLISVWWPR